MTMRLRNPRKLGAAGESWLKHDGLVLECTAATWRYFFCSVLDSRSLVVPLGGSTEVRSALPSVEALRRDTEPTEASTLVVVEDSAGDAILGRWQTLYWGGFAVVIQDRVDEGDELGDTRYRSIELQARMEGLRLTLSLPLTRLNSSLYFSSERPANCLISLGAYPTLSASTEIKT